MKTFRPIVGYDNADNRVYNYAYEIPLIVLISQGQVVRDKDYNELDHQKNGLA